MPGFAYTFLAIFLSGVAFGQSTETPPAFEAADIHLSDHWSSPEARGPFLRGGLYEIRLANLVDLIGIAYGVGADKVWGGPNWLELDRFDVIAKAPPNATNESLRAMLRTLLADRFKLAVHNDSKPMPAYALTTGKHTALKKAEGSGDAGCKRELPAARQQPADPQEPVTRPMAAFACRNMTMAAFAEWTRNMGAVWQDREPAPVVDSTGLTGAWDFNFKFTPRTAAPGLAGETITFLDAIDSQLGLKLDATRVSVPGLVVDSANEQPGANPPNVMETLHLAPLEFEVAEVKPSEPASKGGRFDIRPGGRLFVLGHTLTNLIRDAWNIDGDDLIAGAPKWFDSDRFDIIAKAPSASLGSDASAKQSGPPTVDDYPLMMMLRALLVDRFKMVVHYEDRPVNAYTLKSVKPKLEKADPSVRTSWKSTLPPGAKDPREANPELSRVAAFQNMTMAQFARVLPDVAPDYFHTPILDATGLDGGWDFTLAYTPDYVMRGGSRGGDVSQQSGSVPAASDPSGGLSIFDAVSKQLGLKLEMVKRPLPVLVIDHVERTPTDQ